MLRLLVYCITLHSALSAVAQDAALQVQTAHGPVRGFYRGASRAFLGVPFAAPPVGDGRFAPPRPPAPWHAARNASAWAPACPQSEAYGTEDCLYLNVFTPKTVRPQDRLPVLFWIHGGCYNAGAAWDYPGFKLAAGVNAIVVSTQYRLGFLSFFVTDAQLRASHVNFGFLDQQAALKWVQTNIAAFGGDPKRVMIFGQSAGGGSVAAHLLMPSSAGLYAAAVLESPDSQNALGVCTWYPAHVMAERSHTLAQAAGCGDAEDVLACVRAVPLQRLQIPWSKRIPEFGPVIDGRIVADYPLVLFQQGRFNKVPTIVGSSRCENCWDTNTAWGCPHAVSDADYDVRMALIFGTAAPLVKAWYEPYRRAAGAYFAMARAQSDFSYNCPQHSTANALAAHTSVWFFWWDHVTESWPNKCMNATHAGEIGYLFLDPSEACLLRGPGLTGAEAEVGAGAETEIDRAYWACK